MEPDAPDLQPAPTRSPGLLAAAGGALVVVVVGGIIGGVLATRQPPAPTVSTPEPPAVSPAAPVEPADPVLSMPEPSPLPSPVDFSTPTPTPVPQPAPTTPAAHTASAAPTTQAPARTTAPTRVPPPGSRPDPTWLSQVADATGVPRRALEAYATATLTLQREKASCSLGWNTLAAIGQIESRHGSYGGARLAADGSTNPRIIGPALNGEGFASIPDTDKGALDGDTTWDRAVGPMQFIPSTWRPYGADGNGDGAKDPHNIDDAALAAGRYLCASGGMGHAGGWRNAVIGYNRSEQYLADVARVANEYAMRVPR